MLDEVEGAFQSDWTRPCAARAARPRHVFLVGYADVQKTLRNSASSGQALRPPTFFSKPIDRRKLSLGARSMRPRCFTQNEDLRDPDFTLVLVWISEHRFFYPAPESCPGMIKDTIGP